MRRTGYSRNDARLRLGLDLGGLDDKKHVHAMAENDPIVVAQGHRML